MGKDLYCRVRNLGGKKYLFLVFGIFVFCSCTSMMNSDRRIEPSRHNVDLFENWEIPKELKQSVANYNSMTEKIVIFDKTRTYIPAEKIFVMQALGEGAGLVHVASKHYDYIDGFKDRYDNLALFICSDYLYDGEAIDVGENEEIKQIGVYTYKTVNKEYEQYKTVPVVILVNEEMFSQNFVE